MALYENIFIARQDVSQQQVETMTEAFADLIRSNGGTVGRTEFWGVRNLAYKIKKNRKGHYVLMNIDAPSDAMLEMERNMRLHEDVVRYLTVRVDELEEGPSAMMQSRHRSSRGRDRDRGDRGDRDRGDRDRGGDRGDRDRGPRPQEGESRRTEEQR